MSLDRIDKLQMVAEFALLLGVVSLILTFVNPHYEEVTISVRTVADVRGSYYIAELRDVNNFHISPAILSSVKHNCMGEVEKQEIFTADHCGFSGCRDNGILELRGKGICDIHYQYYKTVLVWGAD